MLPPPPPPHPTEESRPAVVKLRSTTIVPGAARRLNAHFHVAHVEMEAYCINEDVFCSSSSSSSVPSQAQEDTRRRWPRIQTAATRTAALVTTATRTWCVRSPGPRYRGAPELRVKLRGRWAILSFRLWKRSADKELHVRAMTISCGRNMKFSVS